MYFFFTNDDVSYLIAKLNYFSVYKFKTCENAYSKHQKNINAAWLFLKQQQQKKSDKVYKNVYNLTAIDSNKISKIFQ